ncbi:hypothetical protein RvY_14649 [Ramazzottius varieornatus]|uniref:Uncharacterized protein n=1 Tax=Ramazzottius varieornatus TaxID=947166 RepID=A0A1D1VTQ4_RAMVA|nr:hypothetical protein RvY_14649 [Ramazzottius varieornatus]
MKKNREEEDDELMEDTVEQCYHRRVVLPAANLAVTTISPYRPRCTRSMGCGVRHCYCACGLSCFYTAKASGRQYNSRETVPLGDTPLQ